MLILSRILLALLILSAIFWIYVSLIVIGFGASVIMSGISILLSGMLIYFAYDNWMVIDKVVNP